MKNKIVYDGRTFEATDIKSGQIHLAASLPSMKLEPNTFTAVVKSEDKSLTEFTRNTPLYYYYRERLVCISYVQTVDRIGPNKYKFYGTSAIGRLIEQPHAGGIYTGQTAEEVITDICGPVPFEIKNVLKKIKLYGWLPYANPPKRSARDNLVQVLFAIGAAIRTDLDGVLRIEGLWDGISGTVGGDKMYTGANTEYDGIVTQVIVTEHQYVPWTEEKQLFEGTAQAGDIITFDEPMHDLVAQGFTIQASGANWARVSAGSGTLTGKTYIHNTRQVSKAVQEANTPNVKTVEDATLVSLVNSQAVAERLADYYRCRERVDSAVVYQGEAPGDRLATYHPFDKTGVAACLESADITLSNTLKSQEKLLVGYVPPQFEEIVTYDHHEVLTGSGSWQVPDGTTNIIAVLIGGGQAGFDGTNGTVGSGGSNLGDPKDRKSTSKTLSENSTASLSLSASVTAKGYTNGKGGSGGISGTPGKIFRVEIKDISEESIPYACGVAGVSNGSVGSETIFGEHSSKDGSLSQTGYTDTISGIVYALPGVNGTDGGDGGSAGSDGESVNGVSGGTGYSGESFSRSATRSSYYSSPVRYEDIRASINTQISAVGGGGAGGNSGSIPGSSGTRGTQSSGAISITTDSGHPRAIGTKARCYGGSGGDGANGASGATFGSAGSGGGGGGGAGAVNSSSVSVQASCDITVFSNYTGRLEAWAYGYNGYSGSVGKGGTGGAGAPGCIILYYGVHKKSQTGQLVDKHNRMVLDRLGRRIIV